MKKTYIIPQVEVIKINTTEQLLATSFDVNTYNEEAEGYSALGRENYYSDGGRISNPNLWDQQW